MTCDIFMEDEIRGRRACVQLVFILQLIIALDFTCAGISGKKLQVQIQQPLKHESKLISRINMNFAW